MKRFSPDADANPQTRKQEPPGLHRLGSKRFRCMRRRLRYRAHHASSASVRRAPVVLDNHRTRASADDPQPRLFSNTRAGDAGFQSPVAERRSHASASQSRITRRVAGITLLLPVVHCVEFGDGCNSVTIHRAESFLYQVPPSVTPPGGLLGAAVCKNEWPLFFQFNVAYRT